MFVQNVVGDKAGNRKNHLRTRQPAHEARNVMTQEFMTAMRAVGLNPIVIDENTKFDETFLQSTALSPFLPNGVQFAWDSTSLDWLKRCPRMYQYAMLEGWRPRNESPHLRFGIEYHQALHEYDIHRVGGLSHNESLRNVVRDLLLRTTDWDPDHEYKTRDFLIRTVVWYCDHFANDPAKTVVLENGKPACEVSFRFELDYGPENGQDQPFTLSGHLDRVVEYGGELFVMDRKTTTTTPSAFYFNQYEPNNQMSLYTLAGQVVLSATIKGVIIDCAQIAKEFSRFVRGTVYRTKDQLNEWLHDLRYWLGLAEHYARTGYYPQNDTACDKYGGCPFRPVCSKSPGVRKAFLESDYERGEQWNPLKPR